MSRWSRRGIFYYSKVCWTYVGQPQMAYSIERKLDFLAYWLIRFFHGIKGLNEMADKIPQDYYSGPHDLIRLGQTAKDAGVLNGKS